MYKNITLIIPTYNRSIHLSRLLTYYSSLNSNLNFLVLDSSNEYHKNKNQDFIINLSNKKNINYKSYENLEAIHKIRDGLREVKTKYSALCADDDIIFIDTLAEAIVYLENNKNIICVDGLYLNFINGKNGLIIDCEYTRESIDYINRYERVFSLMQKYESLYYGVYRVEELELILDSAALNDNLHFQELHQSVSTLLLGEHHRLNRIYGARQHCEPADEKRSNWQTAYWFAEDSATFIQKYSNYMENIYNFYINNISAHHISKSQFDHFINVSHAVFFSRACDVNYMFQSLASLWPERNFQIPKDISLKANVGIFKKILLKISSILNLFAKILVRLENLNSINDEFDILAKKFEIKKYYDYKA